MTLHHHLTLPDPSMTRNTKQDQKDWWNGEHKVGFDVTRYKTLCSATATVRVNGSTLSASSPRFFLARNMWPKTLIRSCQERPETVYSDSLGFNRSHPENHLADRRIWHDFGQVSAVRNFCCCRMWRSSSKSAFGAHSRSQAQSQYGHLWWQRTLAPWPKNGASARSFSVFGTLGRIFKSCRHVAWYIWNKRQWLQAMAAMAQIAAGQEWKVAALCKQFKGLHPHLSLKQAEQAGRSFQCLPPRASFFYFLNNRALTQAELRYRFINTWTERHKIWRVLWHLVTLIAFQLSEHRHRPAVQGVHPQPLAALALATCHPHPSASLCAAELHIWHQQTSALDTSWNQLKGRSVGRKNLGAKRCNEWRWGLVH